MPSLEYTHDEGGCSITGGPFVNGAYLYGDFCSGLVWLATQGGDGVWSAGSPVETGLSISSFGLGSDGTVYLADLGSGSVYRDCPVTSRRNGSSDRITPSGSSMNGQCPLSSRIASCASGKTSRCRSARSTGA
jgi:hypothetical protein